jgi:phosphoglycerate kinase
MQVFHMNRALTMFLSCGSLHPALYEAALNNVKYYLFTGGGTVLKVIEEGDPMGLATVKALIDNKENYFKSI